jgi:hypothetical protein
MTLDGALQRRRYGRGARAKYVLKPIRSRRRAGRARFDGADPACRWRGRPCGRRRRRRPAGESGGRAVARAILARDDATPDRRSLSPPALHASSRNPPGQPDAWNESAPALHAARKDKAHGLDRALPRAPSDRRRARPDRSDLDAQELATNLVSGLRARATSRASRVRAGEPGGRGGPRGPAGRRSRRHAARALIAAPDAERNGACQ